MVKTNALRLLDIEKIKYEVFEYDNTCTDGMLISKLLNEDPDKVFKTLVTVANTKEHFVFCIPVSQTLNLKKAAWSVGVKSIEMILQKELLPLTGYIHGGCSPVGMKTKFVTVFDEAITLYDDIYVSAGKVGMQMHLNTNDLISYVKPIIKDVIN